MSKNLDPNIQPEKQNMRPLKGNKISQEKPRVGQGRAGMRRRRPPPINQTSAVETSKNFPEVSKIEKRVINRPDFTTPVQSVNYPSAEVFNGRPMIKGIPLYPDPAYRPPPKLIKIPMSEGLENIDISTEINLVF